MRLASKGGIGWREKQAFRWFRLRKRIHQYVNFRPGQAEATLMVVGCQRSGTSMIHHVFRNDFRTATFDEEQIRADIRDTMTAAGGQPLFFIMKDVHTLNGEPDRAARWVALAREEIENAGGL